MNQHGARGDGGRSYGEQAMESGSPSATRARGATIDMRGFVSCRFGRRPASGHARRHDAFTRAAGAAIPEVAAAPPTG